MKYILYVCVNVLLFLLVTLVIPVIPAFYVSDD